MICVVSSCHEREIKQWKKILKPGAANVEVAYVLRVNLVEERV